MESSFDIIWLVIVIIFGIFKFVKKASVSSDSDEAEEAAADSAQVQESQEDSELGAPNFVYYYTYEGQKKVDAVKSAKASGRELTEYEIYSEQQRLDKLWCAELERLEAEAMEAREEAYKAAEPVETPSMEEIMACARSGGAEHIDAEPVPWEAEPVQTTHSSDRDYQLQQLDRWLEAGLIDKKEYKRRKREIE